MARSRNIKPGFFKNEELAECSLAARLCFAGLWLLADREGRLEDRPKRIKGELFPFDTFEVGPLLDELHTHGFIVRYRNADGSFIQISKFLEHQNPHYSEKPSVIKPPALPESEASKPRQLPDNDGDDGGGDSGSTPGKDPPSRGGRNPLNPDSLNPDSLNPSPAEKNARKRAEPVVVDAELLVAEGFDPQAAAEFIAHKARVKAPLTARAWADHCREAGKAGWTPQQAAEKVMAKGWKGFEASYVSGTAAHVNGGPHGGVETARERAARERMQQIAPGVAAKAPGTTQQPAPAMEVVDVAARLLG